MLDKPARIQAWLADLAMIAIEIEVIVPPPLPRAPKRARKRKPLWEE
ncbi:hypothetical protein [Sphingomonas carotinifaciens]|uniref:Uncharacterized protein n=1 Tax=Sphingomonas carotinifaciens TaxID=1166323 RepID=A0A1G7PVD6_9SPHN|nr:hypothetical protein [Sphingomonas carotinifaciens]MBB4087498.1 hypothetical protein [Sphingomonas carotinifaciens]MWC45586.1 hypothetical protein [Sphingomonas carotinifaciens]SDF89589.1 hypothetical protein SAMN05216557_10773 [Sphingomonas carotinifaciens]